MAHLIETMAYAGETPWHGLGVHVGDNLTPDEMMKAAGLDWTVDKVPLQYKFDNKTFALDSEIGGAIIRKSDGKALGFAGPDWVPSQNGKVFEFFDRFVKGGHMKMHTAGSIKNGAEIWGLAQIEKGFKLVGGDEVIGFLLIHSPHVWGKSLSIRFTPTRVVCNNALTMALNEKGKHNEFRMPHLQAFDTDVIKAAESALGLSEAMMAQFQETSAFLASKQITEASIRRYLVDLMQPDLKGHRDAPMVANANELDYDRINFYDKPVSQKLRLAYGAVTQSPGAGLESAKGTWWGAFNAVTFVVDHKLGRTRDTALANAWFGGGAQLKARALDNAVRYARAA